MELCSGAQQNVSGGTLQQTDKAVSIESDQKETRKSKFGLSVFLSQPSFVEPVNHQSFYSNLGKSGISDEAAVKEGDVTSAEDKEEEGIASILQLAFATVGSCISLYPIQAHFRKLSHSLFLPLWIGVYRFDKIPFSAFN